MTKRPRSWFPRLAACALGAAVLFGSGFDSLTSAVAASAKSHEPSKHYRVKVKIKHDVDDAPNWTEYYWTDLWFYDDGWFTDGDYWGEWHYDGDEIHADISDDFEDDYDDDYDDVDAWFKYTDIDVDGDEIHGKLKGELEYEWDFFWFDKDYEEDFKGKFSGYEVDDDWDDDWDWDWWPF